MSDAGMLSGCSDASTNSSAELLDMEVLLDVDEKIAPIFEEDLDEEQDDDEENDDDDCDDEADDDDEDDDDDDDDDEDDEEECVEIDVERDDMDFCGSSRKSTYSVKSSVSRYDKLLTLAAPKQPAALPTSHSFNDNSNATNMKIQELRQMNQIKEQQKVQRWRCKFKVDKKTICGTDAETSTANKKHASSQKNIVKRALLSLALGSGSSGADRQDAGDREREGGSGARPKSTSSLKFGHNKLNFLTAVGHKGSNKIKQKQQQHSSTLNHGVSVSEEEQEAASTSKTTSVTTTTATTATTSSTATTTKTNLGNIITSLLRTTTL